MMIEIDTREEGVDVCNADSDSSSGDESDNAVRPLRCRVYMSNYMLADTDRQTDRQSDTHTYTFIRIFACTEINCHR